MEQDKPGNVDTGTRDETYDIIAVLYHALQGAENCELYAEDAEDDQELRQYFERAGQMQRQLADQGKRLLHDRLMRNMQGGLGGSGDRSAFGQFDSPESGSGEPSAGGTTGASSGQPQQMPDQFGQSGGGRLQNTHMSTGGGGTSTF